MNKVKASDSIGVLNTDGPISSTTTENFHDVFDFPEAETMETRKVKEWSGARKFWMVMFTIAVLMVCGNWIISLIQ